MDLKSLLTGPSEEFRNLIGFTDPVYGPKDPMLAVWLECRDRVPRMYEFLIGGLQLGITFRMNHFYGVDGKGGNSKTSVQCSMDTGLIKLRRGSSMSEWEPIENMFPDIITSPGTAINWTEGSSIFTR